MRGYIRKEVMIDAKLYERFQREVRRRDTRGYYEPTLSRFLNDALSDFLDEYLKEYPIRSDLNE